MPSESQAARSSSLLALEGCCLSTRRFPHYDKEESVLVIGLDPMLIDSELPVRTVVASLELPRWHCIFVMQTSPH